MLVLCSRRRKSKFEEEDSMEEQEEENYLSELSQIFSHSLLEILKNSLNIFAPGKL